jgi:hypothetical protein
LSGAPEEDDLVPVSKTSNKSEKKVPITLDESKYAFYILYHAAEKDLRKTVYPLFNEKVSDVIFTDEKFAAITSPLGQGKYLETLGIDDRILTLSHLFRSSEFYAFAVPKDHEEQIKAEMKEIMDEFVATASSTESTSSSTTAQEGEAPAANNKPKGNENKDTNGKQDDKKTQAAAADPIEPEKDQPKPKKGGKKAEPLITSDKIEDLPDSDVVMKEAEGAAPASSGSKKGESSSGSKHSKRKADEITQSEGDDENGDDGDANPEQVSSSRKKKGKHR